MVRFVLLAVVVLAVCFVGCDKKEAGSGGQADAGWSVKMVKVVDGFDVPECALYDAVSGDVYVSNIVTPDKGYWMDDGTGFLSVLGAVGTVKEMRWVDSTEETPIHGPKGLAVLDGYLYFNDNTNLKRVKVDEPVTVETVALPAAEKLNDLASDGEAVWVSDVGLSKAYRVDKDGKVSEIPAPEAINGITCRNGKIFAVSWELHDLYELDPAGVKEPVAFGLAENFTNLDAIEILDDGTFIVSDFGGGKICSVSPDRKTVKTLVELETPADIGIDRVTGLVYVPQLSINKLAIYKLEKK